MPKEDTVFAAGDEVLVVNEGSEGQVRDLLVGETQDGPPDQDARTRTRSSRRTRSARPGRSGYSRS